MPLASGLETSTSQSIVDTLYKADPSSGAAASILQNFQTANISVEKSGGKIDISLSYNITQANWVQILCFKSPVMCWARSPEGETVVGLQEKFLQAVGSPWRSLSRQMFGNLPDNPNDHNAYAKLLDETLSGVIERLGQENEKAQKATMSNSAHAFAAPSMLAYAYAIITGGAILLWL